MAKKKSTHQPKEAQTEPELTANAPPQLPHNRKTSDSAAPVDAAMDDSSEKLEALRSLNKQLLSQIGDSRSQIEALVQEKNSLEAELTRAREEEGDKGVARVSLETEVGELKGSVESLEREKSELLESLGMEKETLAGVCQERDLLKSDLAKLTEREKSAREEAEKLRVKCQTLGSEKEAKERSFEGLKKERDSIARDLAESVRAVEGMKAENERVSRAKSDLESKIVALEEQLGSESEVARGLRGDVKALQARISEMDMFIAEGMRRMEENVEALSNAKAEKERRIEALESKLSDAEARWERSTAEANGNRMRIEELVQEKSEIEKARVSRETEIVRLNNEVEEFRDALFELRSLCGDQQESNRKLLSEVGGYKEALERVERERNEALRVFDEERKNVEALKLVLSEKEKMIEETSRELRMLSGENKSQQSEIVRLNNAVEELSNALSESQASRQDQEESIRRLVSEVNGYKDQLKRVAHERDEAQKASEEEKKKAEGLKVVVSQKEKRVQEIAQELTLLREENMTLFDKIKGIESRLESLVKERDSAQKNLLKAESTMQEWRAKAESAGLNSEQALIMLKKVASMVSASQPKHGKRKSTDTNQKLDNKNEPYSAEFEAILSAFSTKEKIVEDMKIQLQALKQSADEANRRKSFWTLISSATTLLAAASVAYVAKAQR